MTGIVQRCGACNAEMVIERRHAGRRVPCPRCLAGTDVPANLDFLGVDAAAASDRARTAWVLPVTLIAGFICCLPVSAFACWYASGVIQRARSEEREPDPLLLATRIVAAIFASIQGLVWALVLLGQVL